MIFDLYKPQVILTFFPSLRKKSSASCFRKMCSANLEGKIKTLTEGIWIINACNSSIFFNPIQLIIYLIFPMPAFLDAKDNTKCHLVSTSV